MTGTPEVRESLPSDSGKMEGYHQLRRRLLACIEGMLNAEHTQEDVCLELKERLEANTFNLVVLGQFKRGKTCLINALLGTDILPVGVVPLTSIVTILIYGETIGVRVYFNDGKIREIEPESIREYVTEEGNPKNTKDVREVLVRFPSPYLRDGVRLIDTPGVGSVYIHNTDVAYQYLPKSDAAIFLLSVEQPVSKAELDFLRDVRQFSGKIFFLLNKIDYLSQEEVEQSMAFAQQVLSEVMGTQVRVFPVSAKLALKGKRDESDAVLQKSCLPAFAETLDAFLLNEKGKTLLLSVTSGLQRVVSQNRLRLELEEKSLTAPLDELNERLTLFRSKHQEVLTEKRHFEVLLDSEVAQLVQHQVDQEVASFKAALIEEMERKFDAFCEENGDLSLKELSVALENFITSEVQQAFTAWRSEREEALASAFGAVCNRFLGKIDEIIDSLLTFSSELFSVSFELHRAEPIWTTESGFYYKFKEQSVGLDMLASSLTEVVPGLVSGRFARLKAYLFRMANRRILLQRKEHMLQTIDMQAGRIRYDFVERLDKSKKRFRREMLDRIDATVTGIDAAVSKGMSIRSRGEREAQERLSLLGRERRLYDSTWKELLDIKEATLSG